MRLLDLFTGTQSVAKVARELGFDVTTLDIDKRCGADICVCITEWDYTSFPPGHFDIIWASPPCQTFSCARKCNIGKTIQGEVMTHETLQRDLEQFGIPLLRKTEEIIQYFQPTYFFIENPGTGKMKDYISIPCYKCVVDYCMYGFEYRKRTNVFSNVKLDLKLCDKSHLVDGKHVMTCLGTTKGGHKGQGGGSSRNSRYAIPPILISNVLQNLIQPKKITE